MSGNTTTKLKVGVFNVLAAGMSACSTKMETMENGTQAKVYLVFLLVSYFYQIEPPTPHAKSIYNDLFNEMFPHSMPKMTADELRGHNIPYLTDKAASEFKNKLINKIKKDYGKISMADFFKLNMDIEISTPTATVKIPATEVTHEHLLNIIVEFIELIEPSSASASASASASPPLLSLFNINKTHNSFSSETFETVTSKDKKKHLASLLKQYSAALEFGLYGGFKIGRKADVPMTALTRSAAGSQSSVEPFWNPESSDMETLDWKNKYFELKLEFMKKQINQFFKGLTQPAILVCPEFDYFLSKSNEETRFFSGLSLKGIKEIRTGNYRNPSPEESAYTEFVTEFDTETNGKSYIPVPKKFNSNSNHFRGIFFSGLDVIDITEDYEKEKEYLQVFNKTKNRIDILRCNTQNTTFYLIAFHLDSTTSISNIETKTKEIAIINLIKNDLVKKGSVIIAGDLNFPDLRLVAQSENTIPGFEGVIKPKHKIDMEEFFNAYKIEQSDPNIGACLKERYTETLGNDQLWEGKGDRRSYNTDFIGYCESKQQARHKPGAGPIHRIATVPERPKTRPPGVIIKLKDQRLSQIPALKQSSVLHPYYAYETLEVPINSLGKYDKAQASLENKILNTSWLSDHSLVYTDITLEPKLYISAVQALSGGARKSKRRRRRGSKRRNRSKTSIKNLRKKFRKRNSRKVRKTTRKRR